MSMNKDFRSAVQKNSQITFERLQIVEQLSDFRMTEIKAAVVFVFALWSGPSIMAFKKFTQLLKTLELGSIEVIVLDNDCMNGKEMVQLFGHVFHGVGEIVWIKNGRMVAELRTNQQDTESVIVQNTKLLM